MGAWGAAIQYKQLWTVGEIFRIILKEQNSVLSSREYCQKKGAYNYTLATICFGREGSKN